MCDPRPANESSQLLIPGCTDALIPDGAGTNEMHSCAPDFLQHVYTGAGHTFQPESPTHFTFVAGLQMPQQHASIKHTGLGAVSFSKCARIPNPSYFPSF